MALYPIHVEVNEANILKITQTYKEAYKQIVAQINGATDFGVANRKAILKQIEGILTKLGVDTDEFIRTELPKYYEKGADQAVSQLKNVGADIPVSTGFNRIHEEAINALVDDTAKAFGESLTGVGRSANSLLGRATREQITQKMAEGFIGGNAMREVKKSIKGILAEQGLDVLVDKGGKAWSLDRYSEMLFRTKAVEARNRGLVNRMVENEYDLVQVSNHFGSCETCAPWEGKILSVTGQTKGYPTLQEAEAAGLFHPNCRHAVNTLIPSLAKLTNAYYPDEETKQISEEEIAKLSDIDIKENAKKVFRAEDSRTGKAVLGEGTYVAFDANNAGKYGKDVVTYSLDPVANLLDLSDPVQLTKFTDQAIEAYKDEYMKLLDEGNQEKALAVVMRKLAEKLKYQGIIGDDDAFGTVIFDPKIIKKL